MKPSHLDFRGMIDASPNPYLVLDRDLHIAFANRAYLQSVKRDLADLVGRWAWEAFPTDPETEAQAMASFERVKATRQPDTMALLRFDVPRPEAEGGGMERRWWSITHAPVLDDAGEVALIVQHPIDVTDLERLRDAAAASGDEAVAELQLGHTGIFARAQSVSEANLALKADSDRLRELFAQAPSFMAVLSGPEHVFEHVNAAYQRLIDHRDVVGQPLREALPEIAGQGFVDLLDRVYRTGEPFVGRGVPITLKPAPGASPEERVLDFVYQPIVGPDGTPSGIFVEGSDVTERVRADAALRTSEARYRQIVEGAEDFAIVTLDEHGIITGWNSGAERIMGWSREEAIGQTGAMFFTPEDRAAGAPEHEMNRAASHGRAVDERWHLKRDGSRFWGSGLMMRLDEEGGGYLKIFRDRTPEHEAEAALRAEQDRYRTLFEAIDAGFCVVEVRLDAPDGEGGSRTDYRVVEANPAFYRQTGFPEAILGQWLRQAAPTLEEHWYETYGRVARTGDPARFEQGSDLLGRWFDVHAFRVGEPAQARVAILFDDISNRRQAEVALQNLNATLEERVAERTAERNLLATIVETTDVLVMALDLDYAILAINKANVDEFERIYGVRPRVGDNVLALLADKPEEQAQVRAGWGRGLAGEELTFVEDFGDPTHDRPYYEVKFRTLRDATGERVGAYQFVTDVTDRLRKEAQLAEAQEALRQSQKMEAMGSLTGGVAHDFNNLLTPIIGSLDRLVSRGVGSERERRLMAGALESAERARVLVQRLLAFARRQPLQAVAVDVEALVEGMAGLIGSTLGPTIDVRVDLAPDLPPAKADPNQLEMALLNLAVNARDAMPGGGALTVAASRESVRGQRAAALGLRPGHYVRLSVTDTGVGMDKATRARAVEPFFSTKGVGRGTGLGLSMVHGLASQLGGGLAIDSAPGRGTTVALWLPVSAEPITEDDGERVASQPVALRGRALLVDDEDLVRMSTADMLAEMGFEVLEAGSAEEALGRLREGAAVDLLVTDHLMPGMSGAELAREARALRPDLPALIVSGYAEVDGIAPGLPRLVKPFRAAELAERVAALVPGAPPAG